MPKAKRPIHRERAPRAPTPAPVTPRIQPVSDPTRSAGTVNAQTAQTAPPTQKDERDENGRFLKGHDVGKDTRWVKGMPSPNPGGRPSTFGQLRHLFQEIGNEEIAGTGKEGKPNWTQLQRMIRAMYVSKSATDRQNALEFGFGKVPNETKMTGSLRVGLTSDDMAKAETFVQDYERDMYGDITEADTGTEIENGSENESEQYRLTRENESGKHRDSE